MSSTAAVADPGGAPHDRPPRADEPGGRGPPSRVGGARAGRALRSSHGSSWVGGRPRKRAPTCWRPGSTADSGMRGGSSEGSSLTLWTHLRSLNLAERYPPTPEIAQAYSEHAPAMMLLPWHRRGVRFAQRSHAIRVRLGDRWGQGQSLHFWGAGLYAASDFDRSLERMREALELLESHGRPVGDEQLPPSRSRWPCIGSAIYRAPRR